MTTSQMLEQNVNSRIVYSPDEASMSDPNYPVMSDILLPTALASNNKEDESDHISIPLMEFLKHTEELKETISFYFRKNNVSSTIIRILDIGELNWELLRQLEKIKDTPEDERWPDAKWPTEQAFDDAEKFIGNLDPTIPAPHISLANDGEINFWWNDMGVYIDLGFYGTGSYSYYAKDKEGEEYGDEEISASNGLPQEIMNLFTA